MENFYGDHQYCQPLHFISLPMCLLRGLRDVFPAASRYCKVGGSMIRGHTVSLSSDEARDNILSYSRLPQWLLRITMPLPDIAKSSHAGDTLLTFNYNETDIDSAIVIHAFAKTTHSIALVPDSRIRVGQILYKRHFVMTENHWRLKLNEDKVRRIQHVGNYTSRLSMERTSNHCCNRISYESSRYHRWLRHRAHYEILRLLVAALWRRLEGKTIYFSQSPLLQVLCKYFPKVLDYTVPDEMVSAVRKFVPDTEWKKDNYQVLDIGLG